MEQGTLTPLVFTVLGEWARKMSNKVANYIRGKIAVTVFRSALLCLRRSRAVRKEKTATAVAEDID